MGFGALLGGVQLPFAGSVQQLTSSAFGLVLQPQALPGTPQAIQAQLQLLRTSAILQLELQPLPAQAAQQAVQAAAAYTPAQLVPQEWLSLLQGRVTDPWVQMAQLHASGQQPRHPPAGEGLRRIVNVPIRERGAEFADPRQQICFLAHSSAGGVGHSTA